ncbi:MAG: hypothetical protein B7X57_08615 [Erythrobacter sp. 34-65-8]|nr:MAG: hypothetical protein B7X57_08615 [Erythrobacter sp. 34-65-8]
MILNPFEWTIARRYLLPGRSEAFIALVAGISVVVVMLSVAMAATEGVHLVGRARSMSPQFPPRTWVMP